MKISALLQDKSLKNKAKTEMLSNMVNDKKISIDELLDYAKKAKDSEKATCIEALEYASKNNPSVVTETCLKFLTSALADDAPRVKWEAARVIGNIASSFPSKLKPAIKELLINTEHEGTVVRWATAYALGEILKLKTNFNKELLPAIEAICNRETDNSVKKKYLEAIKKIKPK